MKRSNVWIAVALITAVACGGSSSTGNQQGNTPLPPGGISVANDFYNPTSKTVAVGATVQWSWNTCTSDGYSTQTCYLHSVTFDDGQTSSTQDQGSYSRSFATAGTYNYHCLVHPTMRGSIVVQ